MPKIFLEAGRSAISSSGSSAVSPIVSPRESSSKPSSSAVDQETFGAAVDKAAVAKAFSKAAATYTETAEIQQRIANYLLRLLKKHLSQAASLKSKSDVPVVIDLGSGTGSSLQQLSELTGAEQVIALDLSRAMLSAIPESSNILTVAADFDFLPLDADVADAIFSSMSMQWSNYPEQLVNRLAQVIKPGGILAFSTLLEGSLSEIDIAWQKLDGSKHGLTHPSLEHWKAWVEQIAVPLSFERREEVQYFSSVKQLLQSVRGIGASDHRLGRKKAFLGKRNYQAFIDALSSVAWDEVKQSFKLSYSVLYAVVQKDKLDI